VNLAVACAAQQGNSPPGLAHSSTEAWYLACTGRLQDHSGVEWNVTDEQIARSVCLDWQKRMRHHAHRQVMLLRLASQNIRQHAIAGMPRWCCPHIGTALRDICAAGANMTSMCRSPPTAPSLCMHTHQSKLHHRQVQAFRLSAPLDSMHSLPTPQSSLIITARPITRDHQPGPVLVCHPVRNQHLWHLLFDHAGSSGATRESPPHLH
jgi:hypothetical protein